MSPCPGTLITVEMTLWRAERMAIVLNARREELEKYLAALPADASTLRWVTEAAIKDVEQSLGVLVPAITAARGVPATGASQAPVEAAGAAEARAHEERVRASVRQNGGGRS